MSYLGNLKPTVSKGAKRLGRGYGSGKGGHTSGRGMKGMGARKSGSVPLWFEGGQLPLTKRMPMLRGKAKFNVVRPTAQLSLTDLEKMSISEISIANLKENKIIDKRFHKVKIVATGELKRKVTIVDVRTTKAAKEAIEKAGGEVKAV